MVSGKRMDTGIRSRCQKEREGDVRLCMTILGLGQFPWWMGSCYVPLALQLQSYLPTMPTASRGESGEHTHASRRMSAYLVTIKKACSHAYALRKGKRDTCTISMFKQPSALEVSDAYSHTRSFYRSHRERICGGCGVGSCIFTPQSRIRTIEVTVIRLHPVCSPQAARCSLLPTSPPCLSFCLCSRSSSLGVEFHVLFVFDA